MARDVIIGIDAGTSVMKSVAFSLDGEQIAAASRPNNYTLAAGARATQDMHATWADCVATLSELTERVPDLRARTAAIAVTGQGDGTWLVDADGEPTTDGLLWLDGRSNPIVSRLRGTAEDDARYEITGTGLAACQMGPQLLHLKEETPEAVAKAATGFHCKDYLYLKLTGVRATDPTEGCCSFGDFRTRTYSDDVLHALGLSAEKHLLPPMVDGTKEQHALTAEAAAATGLPEGTPVALGYLDVPCTAMGAGIYDPHSMPGCSIVGSTGIHMKLLRAEDVVLNEGRSGYAMVLPVAGWVALLQSNMAATLNIDWILKTAAALLSDQGAGEGDFRTLLPHIDRWVADTEPGELIYHPYISEAGERGPIVDGAASASFLGLSTRHGFPHMVRAVLEGLGYAARDCYEATGGPPNELRLGGGAARSKTLRKILAAALDTPVRPSLREEMGAAGAAMIGAVGIGAYPSMDDCVKVWADPSVQDAEAPDPALVERYAKMFPAYLQARKVMQPLWGAIAEARHG